MTTVSTSPPPSLAAWQARALHTITCPSGQRLRIRILGLGTLLEHGDVPEDLVDIALLEITSEGGAGAAVARDVADSEKLNDAGEVVEIDEEKRARAMKRLSEFGGLQRVLAITAIEQVETGDGEWAPIKLTLDDVDALPEDDLAMVAAIVQRLRGTDAKGVTIGVEPLDRWGLFREAHGCADEGCEGCAEVVRRVSSSHLGEV